MSPALPGSVAATPGALRRAVNAASVWAATWREGPGVRGGAVGVGVEYQMLMSRPDPHADGSTPAPARDLVDLRTCTVCGRAREGSAWCLRCLEEFPVNRAPRRPRTRVRYEREVTYSLVKGNAVQFGIGGRLLFTAPWFALVAAGVWASVETSDTKFWVLHALWTSIAVLTGMLALRETWTPARHVKVHKIIELD